jgi:hypothetical protein
MDEKGNTLNEKAGKIANFLESRYFFAVIIVLVAGISFILGRISKIEDSREPVRILSDQSAAVANPAISPSNSVAKPTNNPINTGGSNLGQVVGSKNGTKYHLPTCPGAKQISAQNLITFNSIEEARAKGYTPASNCKGLK